MLKVRGACNFPVMVRCFQFFIDGILGLSLVVELIGFTGSIMMEDGNNAKLVQRGRFFTFLLSASVLLLDSASLL